MPKGGRHAETSHWVMNFWFQGPLGGASDIIYKRRKSRGHRDPATSVEVYRYTGTQGQASSGGISHAKAQAPANFINGNIWVLKGFLGDFVGAEVAVKSGVDGVNG